MNRTGDDRRRFLKGVGAAATFGLAVGAGCLNNASTGTTTDDGGNGDSPQTTATTETSTTTETKTTPAYDSSQWVPSPGSITDVASFAVGWRRIGAVTDHMGKMGDDAAFAFERPINSRARWFGLDVGKMDTVLRFGPPVEADPDLTGMNVVIETSYDDESLISALQTEGATDRTGTYEGYSLHRMSGRAVGVKDGTLIACIQTGGISATNLTRRVIDTAAGEFPSYYESLELYQRGRDRLGEMDVGRIVTHDPTEESSPAEGIFPNSMTEGFRWQLNPADAGFKLVTVFSRAEDADEDAIREFADASDVLGAADYSVSTDGSLVELTGSVSYGSLSGDVPYPAAFTN